MVATEASQLLKLYRFISFYKSLIFEKLYESSVNIPPNLEQRWKIPEVTHQRQPNI